MSKNFIQRIYTSIILFLVLFLMLINNYILGYVLLIVSIFSFLEFSKMISIIFNRKKITQLFINLFFISYIFSLSASLLIFSAFLHIKILIFLILIVCVASDIGGFLFGKILKGPRLIHVSPKKTISGAIGSFILSSFIAVLGIYYLTENFDPYVIIIGIVTSLSCQIGDLIFSLLKRKSFLKDTGNFLPGHGGVLDRIDAMLLGIPIGFLTLIIIY